MITRNLKGTLIILSPAARLMLLLIISDRDATGNSKSFVGDVKRRFGCAVRSKKAKAIFDELREKGAIGKGRTLSEKMAESVDKIDQDDEFNEYNHIVDYCNGTISSITRPTPQYWTQHLHGAMICYELRQYKRELWRMRATAVISPSVDSPEFLDTLTIDPKELLGKGWSERRIIANMAATVTGEVVKQIHDEVCDCDHDDDSDDDDDEGKPNLRILQ